MKIVATVAVAEKEVIEQITSNDAKYKTNTCLSSGNCITRNEQFWKYVFQIPVKRLAFQPLTQILPS